MSWVWAAGLTAPLGLGSEAGPDWVTGSQTGPWPVLLLLHGPNEHIFASLAIGSRHCCFPGKENPMQESHQ